MSYTKVSRDDMIHLVKIGHYKTGTDARRAVAKSALSEKSKEKVRRAIDKYFGPLPLRKKIENKKATSRQATSAGKTAQVDVKAPPGTEVTINIAFK